MKNSSDYICDATKLMLLDLHNVQIEVCTCRKIGYDMNQQDNII